MTPDIDKWQSVLQWIGGLGVFVGGVIATIWARAVRSPPPPLPQVVDGRDEHIREMELERAEMVLKIKADEIRRDLEAFVDGRLYKLEERLGQFERILDRMEAAQRPRPR